MARDSVNPRISTTTGYGKLSDGARGTDINGFAAIATSDLLSELAAKMDETIKGAVAATKSAQS